MKTLEDHIVKQIDDCDRRIETLEKQRLEAIRQDFDIYGIDRRLESLKQDREWLTVQHDHYTSLKVEYDVWPTEILVYLYVDASWGASAANNEALRFRRSVIASILMERKIDLTRIPVL